MYTKTLTTIILTAIFLTFASAAYACTTQYGGGECPSNAIVINKKVRYPTNPNLFVENLTKNDDAYSPDSEVEYDVAVTNTSNVHYQTVTVIDQFPSQVTFVGGPGRYDKQANTLTYEISDLDAGETAHNRILVRTKDASVFSTDQDITCDIVNTVNVTGPDGISDQDTSTLCVRTKILGVTTLPVAGFEDTMLIVGFIILAILGFGIARI